MASDGKEVDEIDPPQRANIWKNDKASTILFSNLQNKDIGDVLKVVKIFIREGENFLEDDMGLKES